MVHSGERVFPGSWVGGAGLLIPALLQRYPHPTQFSLIDQLSPGRIWGLGVGTLGKVSQSVCLGVTLICLSFCGQSTEKGEMAPGRLHGINTTVSSCPWDLASVPFT